MKAPLSVGRVLYFALLVGLLCLGIHWAWRQAVFVHAVGLIEQEVDRLAPREAGRIVRVAVQPGDRVHKGQPLVWLDYANGLQQQEGSGYISDQAARAGTERQRLVELERRRDEIEQRRALLRADLAALQARALGLRQQWSAVASAQEAAERLEHAGAATRAEVIRLHQQRAALEQEHAAALAESRQKQQAEQALGAEAARIDHAIATLRAAPAPAQDPGLILAPRDGVVAWVAHRAGEVVGPADAVVLLRSGPVRVRAYIQPRDARDLAEGTAVHIELPTGERLAGRVLRQHLLATSLAEGRAPRDPAPTSESAFLLADIELLDLPAALAERLVAGTPCEVWARRGWLRTLLPDKDRR
ncbi:MAG: HlyD family efflux transporter periplasmic adaptor subunit [Myxococcales bacterium]|nr:HlyD family efflux transporter periplasmic adaptor subunit [Myxococcota bacterium]MDW8283277.1 HlyD family efflux transporter periplasmic adaptor subunit [Myxococcales bacterium]